MPVIYRLTPLIPYNIFELDNQAAPIDSAVVALPVHNSNFSSEFSWTTEFSSAPASCNIKIQGANAVGGPWTDIDSSSSVSGETRASNVSAYTFLKAIKSAQSGGGALTVIVTMGIGSGGSGGGGLTGFTVVTSVGSPGSDTNIPSEKATRAAISSAGGGDVSGPASANDGNVVSFSGTTGKLVADSGKVLPTGDFVGTGGVQTLNGKTLVTPVIASFANANHNHAGSGSGGNIPVSSVTGLQTALDGKAPTSHAHAIADVTNLQTTLDGKSPTSHVHSNPADLANAALGSGIADATKFLRGDRSWQVVSGGGGATSLDELTDVQITTPQDGDYIEFDGTSSLFKNVNTVEIVGNEDDFLVKGPSDWEAKTPAEVLTILGVAPGGGAGLLVPDWGLITESVTESGDWGDLT